MTGNGPINLYSDTQSLPTAAMRAAIHAADVGDEQSRLDPTVTALCEEVADWLGQEAAMFLPTGTMCNLVAIATHTQPGDAVVVHRLGHIVRSETGHVAAASGVVTDLVDGPRGQFGVGALHEALEPGSRYRPHPRLLCLEQTHNFAGGTVWALDDYRAVAGAAQARGMAVHVDGARLANAVVATGVGGQEWGRGMDSVWIDFTKGLGAPLGAVLAGSAAFIEAAWLYKHRFGGAMRQAGMMAAGCRYALAHHVDRLAEDHERARRLGAALAELGFGVQPVESNMVFVDPAPRGLDAATLAAAVAQRGVRCAPMLGRIRLVTHLDIDDAAIDAAITAFSGVGPLHALPAADQVEGAEDGLLVGDALLEQPAHGGLRGGIAGGEGMVDGGL